MTKVIYFSHAKLSAMPDKELNPLAKWWGIDYTTMPRGAVENAVLEKQNETVPQQ